MATYLNIQINDLVREMTDTEHTQYLADQTVHIKRRADEARATALRVSARASATAKLRALGLNDTEIAEL